MSLDQTFQALADPARRSMLARLARGPASVSELAAPLAMSLPAVLQHLAVLEASALIRTAKVGRVRECRLDPLALGRAEDWLATQRLQWDARLDQLNEYLKGNSDGPKPDSKRRSRG